MTPDIRAKARPAPEISVVSPVYAAEEQIDELCARLNAVLRSVVGESYEIILVEDGGTDGSWERIVANCRAYHNVTGIRLRRNFGQHSAILAGLKHSRGAWVVVMDCDLQDVPEEIARLYSAVSDDVDAVWAVRRKRRDGFFKSLTSRAFYALLGYLTETRIDSGRSNYGIFSRRLVDIMSDLRQATPWLPELVRWAGARERTIQVEHATRARGRSSYSLRRRLRFALDIIVLSTEKPLRITVAMGLLLSFSAVLYGSYVVYSALNSRIGVPGWSSLIVSVWFLSGLIVFTLGVVGLYVGKIYQLAKGRPCYVTDEIVSAEER